ncbi:glycosyltransferase family 2 protein [Polynucleobacter paneuropaeus]|nr:glycosyltransferase family 2 protein [Polynucleobacter paneuropaeus]
MKPCSLSVVIPIYNSEKILDKLVDELFKVLPEIAPIGNFEVILVNDCSPDNSWKLLTELASKYDWLRVLNLRKNVGQHNALMAGLKFSSGEKVILMDDDLQHSPADISKLLEGLNSGADICYAKFSNKKHAGWKVMGSRFNDWTAAVLLDKPLGIALSSFKAIKRDMVEQIIKYDGPYVYIDGLVLAATSSIVNVEINHHARLLGSGNYGFIKSFFLWTKMVTNFSIFPLRIATFIGATFSIIGLVAGIVLIAIKMSGLIEVAVMGWTSLACLILFIGGCQLLVLGAIGEYLGRTYIHINGKPQYSIKEVLNGSNVSL